MEDMPCSFNLKNEDLNTADCLCAGCSKLHCQACAKLPKRNTHEDISPHEVSELRSSILHMGTYCVDHNDHRKTLFCSEHDELICDVCHSETHRDCPCVLMTEEAAKEPKFGTSLDDLQKRMTKLSVMLLAVIKKKKENSASLDERRKSILQQISYIRHQIDKYLDKIEKEVNENLESQYSICKKNAGMDISRLEKRHKEVETWTKEVMTLQFKANEVQLFQCTKMLDAKARTEETEIEKHYTMNHLEFLPNIAASKLSEILKSIGQVVMKKENIKIPAPQDKVIQSLLLKKKEAEMPFPIGDNQSLAHGQTRVVLNRIFSFKTSVFGPEVKVERCGFIQNKKILLSDYDEPFLYVCNYDGNDVETIKLEHNPFAIAMLDSKQAVVTLWSEGYRMLDVTTRTLGECVKPDEGKCFAVTCNKGQFWFDTGDRHVVQVEANGKVLRTITTKYEPWDIRLNADGILYYTAFDDNTIQLVTEDGHERTLYSNPDLYGPTGIDSDNDGNLYVAGSFSNNIHKISPDGHTHQVILTVKDGISGPDGLCYNKETNEILVVNQDGQSVEIYKIL